MGVKQHILSEIARMAKATGRAPGKRAFEFETGIKENEWFPHIWLRWGDAVEEAGLARNEMQVALTNEHLLGVYAALARRLGRLPLLGEMIREAKADPAFPSEKTFRRFGGRQGLLTAVADYSRAHPEFAEVVAYCEAGRKSKAESEGPRQRVVTGFVYLMKSGAHYKIGRTKSMGRREWELGIKIPVPPKTLHFIETDDPVGVEAYWHKRFAEKRGEGEWFNLNADDVQAFKRWKRIV